MNKTLQLSLTPEQAHKEDLLLTMIAEKLQISVDGIDSFRILKKSIDARTIHPKINMTVAVFLTDEEPDALYNKSFDYQQVGDKEPVLIVGAGPAGLFAALKLLELGLKPVILERGRPINQRVEDVNLLQKEKATINPESNFAYGEGGAGTFSDGKLLTRSKKKGNIQGVLETFHYHGAKDSILYDSNPHIGFDVLPTIIHNIRKTILSHGGEIHYEEKLSKILLEDNEVKGCETEKGNRYLSERLILATGQSAQDIYELLDEQGIALELKAFAMGVRVEHPQNLIDQIQYKTGTRNPYLPPAIYGLNERIYDRSVYSFCMCPGGEIIPAMTGTEEIVVNGMSSSKRDSAFANAGMVVEIQPEDIPAAFHRYGAFAGLKYRQHIEHAAFIANGGKGIQAPAQRMLDFVKRIQSTDLPAYSYQPGLVPTDFHKWLPDHIYKPLQEAFFRFNDKMKGFLTNEAVVVGVETRSSSPIRIPRDPYTAQHRDIKGLYPAGEGSGYSGGITSSAMDGEFVAEKVVEFFTNP